MALVCLLVEGAARVGNADCRGPDNPQGQQNGPCDLQRRSPKECSCGSHFRVLLCGITERSRLRLYTAGAITDNLLSVRKSADRPQNMSSALSACFGPGLEGRLSLPTRPFRIVRAGSYACSPLLTAKHVREEGECDTGSIRAGGRDT